jgi:hypothetical protein
LEGMVKMQNRIVTSNRRIAIGNEEAQAAEARLHALEARLTRLPIVRYDRSIRYRVTRAPSPRRLICTRCAFGICRRGR